MRTETMALLLVTLGAGLALFVLAPRHGEKRTLGQRIVRMLGVWSRFWRCVYVAADQALVYFHLEREQNEIEPENEYAKSEAR